MRKTYMLCAAAPMHISDRIRRIRKTIFSRYGIVSAMVFDEIIPIAFYTDPPDKILFSKTGKIGQLQLTGTLHISHEAVYAEVVPAQIFSLLGKTVNKNITYGLFKPANGFFLSKLPEKRKEIFIEETAELIGKEHAKWERNTLQIIETEYEKSEKWEEAISWNIKWEIKL